MEMKEFKNVSILSLDSQSKSPLSERRQAVLHSKCFHVLLNTQYAGYKLKPDHVCLYCLHLSIVMIGARYGSSLLLI